MSDAVFNTRKTRSGARDLTRCLVAGSCAGFRELLDLLAGSGAAEIVQLVDLPPGAEQSISAVLLATDGSSDWTHELGRVRERTDAAVLLVSPSASTEMLDAALEADVEDVLVLP